MYFNLSNMNNKILNIGLDLDGVTFCFWSNFKNYIHKYHNKPIDEMSKDPISWEFYRDWGISDEQFMKYFVQGINDGYIFKIGSMIDNASHYINLLYNEGHKIHIISNRSIPGAEDMALENTRHWLEKHNIQHESLTFVKDKAHTVDKYNLDIFIEDSPKNAKQISEAGCEHILLFDQKWNQKDSNFRRVYSWKEIYDYIMNLL